VLGNVQHNEIFCLGVSVSVDGDEGGDSYSPLGDFELDLEGSDDDRAGDLRDRDLRIRDNEHLADGNRGRQSISSREPMGFWDRGDLHLVDRNRGQRSMSSREPTGFWDHGYLPQGNYRGNHRKIQHGIWG
jgi:hypothetical protein